MHLSLIATGKTSQPWIQEGIDVYAQRLVRYTKFSYVETPNLRESLPRPTQRG